VEFSFTKNENFIILRVFKEWIDVIKNVMETAKENCEYAIEQYQKNKDIDKLMEILDSDVITILNSTLIEMF